MILKIPIRDFSITSYWSCAEKEVKGQKVWKIKNAPSLGSASFPFAYTIPSGAEIKKAIVWSVLGTPPSGISQCSVNGIMFTEKRGRESGAIVKISALTGQYNGEFKYRANGMIYKDANQHYASLTFTGTYLELEWEYVDGKPATVTQTTSEQTFSPPPQSVCIYDQDEGSIYLFDGVQKVQHAMTMDIQEEPSKHAKEYVNNARNEPDKVTLDVMMSDVYSGGGAMFKQEGLLSGIQRTGFENTKGSLIARNSVNPWTRSEAALYTLHWLKEQRKKLTVITPQFVHIDMILASVIVDHDDTCPFGWKGQITLQHAFQKEPEKKTVTKATGDGNGQISGSIISLIMGVTKDAGEALAKATGG